MILLIIGTILNFYTNDVVIKRADSTLIPYLGIEIMDEDTIIVKDSSKAEILYPDSSTLFIDENSIVTTTCGKKRSIFLSLGRIWAKVRGLLKGESFEINNPVSVSGVRGTEFTVSYKEGESEVDVLEGSVNVRELVTGKEVLLERERLAKIKRGMEIEIKKFRLEDIKHWNRWKEAHLKFLIKKIERALEQGNILQASLLIDQGYALARRLRLTDEYRSKIEKLKEKYEIIREKQGTIRGKIQDLQYSLRKINPLLQRIEPSLADLRGLVDHLLSERKELEGYIRENKRLEATQMLSSVNFLMDQIEFRINKIPQGALYQVAIKADRDYNLIKGMKLEKGLDVETRNKIKTIAKEVEELRERVQKLKIMLNKIITDYNRVKHGIPELKHKL